MPLRQRSLFKRHPPKKCKLSVFTFLLTPPLLLAIVVALYFLLDHLFVYLRQLSIQTGTPRTTRFLPRTSLQQRNAMSNYSLAQQQQQQQQQQRVGGHAQQVRLKSHINHTASHDFYYDYRNGPFSVPTSQHSKWQVILDNPTADPYSEVTPHLDVIWTRGWYNAKNVAPLFIPLDYYNNKEQAYKEFEIPLHHQQLYWNPHLVCSNNQQVKQQQHVYLWIPNKNIVDFARYMDQQKQQFSSSSSSSLVLSKCNMSIITSNGDYDIPSKYPYAERAFLQRKDSIVHRWYAQNVVQNHSKLVPIPIGLDLDSRLRGTATTETTADKDADMEHQNLNNTAAAAAAPSDALEHLQTRIRIRTAATDFAKRSNGTSILVDVGTMGGCRMVRAKLRVPLLQSISQCQEMQVLLGKKTRIEAYQTYASYQFVTAPSGCGWDTYRLWECLFLGTVPIVLSSQLTRLLLLPAHVPVLVLDSWDELCVLSRNKTLYQQVVERYQGWIPYVHHWLRPSLWIPRDQARMETLCDEAPGCREAAKLEHRMMSAP